MVASRGCALQALDGPGGVSKVATKLLTREVFIISLSIYFIIMPIYGINISSQWFLFLSCYFLFLIIDMEVCQPSVGLCRNLTV